MPGFIIRGVGEDGPPNTVETLRKHRGKISLMSSYISDAPREVLLMAKDVELPDRSIEKIEILGTDRIYKYAKRTNYPDASITFYDDGEVTKFLNEWIDLVSSSKKGISQHSDYKGNVNIDLLDGEGKTKLQYKLSGAWPSKITNGSLTYTSSEIKIITVIITFDDIEITKNNSQSSATTSATPAEFKEFENLVGAGSNFRE